MEGSHAKQGGSPSLTSAARILRLFHPVPSGSDALSASPLWARTALGRRSEIRWPGHLGLFDVFRDDTRVELANFSVGGLGVVVPPSIGSPVGRAVDLELRRSDTPFARVRLEITHAAESHSGRVLGGRFIDGSVVRVATAKGGSEPRDDILEIRDDVLRGRVVERLGALQAQATVRMPGDRTLAVSLRPGKESAPLCLSVENGSGGELTSADGSRVTVEAAVGGGSFFLRGTLRHAEGQWSLARPIEAFSVGRRRCERAAVEAPSAVVEWRHPLDPSRLISARVRDISPGGVGTDAPEDPSWLPPLPGVPVLLRVGQLEFPIHVEVRRAAGPTAARIGLAMVSAKSTDCVLLTRAYQHARWPALGLRRDEDGAALDELMEASGYSALREGTEPAPGWHAPPGDERLTVDLVYRSEEDRPLGHVSCLRAYRNTWIYHQLATLPGSRHRVAYPLYVLITEWALALAIDEGFAIAYFDQSKRWHQTMFSEFVRWTGNASLSVVTSLDRLERSQRSEPAPAADPSLCVRRAGRGDLRLVVELARSFLPRLTADALDIHEHAVACGDLCPEHAAVGLERSRVAFVVERDGETLGVALCETGSRRLSLFNILNMAHVFFGRGVADSAVLAAQAALLSAVLAFYERLGVHDPLVVTPAGTLRRPETSGLAVVETMGLWAASTDGLRQWRNYIHLELGFRAARDAQAGWRPVPIPPERDGAAASVETKGMSS